VYDVFKLLNISYKKKMDNKFLFSIIVPVYNTEKYIEKCLKSIQEAIDTDCEVIIINDGATDNSENRIMKFIDNLDENYKNNYKYIKKANKGLADTKNVGIEEARGEYISVVDSDDYISKDFYEIARKYTNVYDIIIYDLYIVFEKNKSWNYTSRAWRDDKDNQLVALLNGAMSGSSCNKIIKKELYNEYKFPVGKEYEDTAVTPFILTDAKNVKYVPYPLYYYLQREKSIVATNTLMSAFYKICNNITDVLNEKNKDYEKYKYIINEFFVDRIYGIFIQDFTENRNEFISNISEFEKNNRDIINYIINTNMVKECENHYSNEQKEIVEKILKLLSQNMNKELEDLLSDIAGDKDATNIKPKYLQNVKHTFKAFVKALVNK